VRDFLEKSNFPMRLILGLAALIFIFGPTGAAGPRYLKKQAF
jgi:hypothetical protein